MTESQFEKVEKLLSQKQASEKDIPKWTIPILVCVVGFFLVGEFNKNSGNPVTIATLKAQVDSNTATIARLSILEGQMSDLKALAQNTSISINELKNDMKERTAERFTTSDADPIRADIVELKSELSKRVGFMSETSNEIHTLQFDIKMLKERLDDLEDKG